MTMVDELLLGFIPCSMQSSAGADMLIDLDVTGQDDHYQVRQSPYGRCSCGRRVLHLHGQPCLAISNSALPHSPAVPA